jgi:hypothetical protein
MDAGVIDRVPVEPLAHLLLGAALEAGMLNGRADDTPPSPRPASSGDCRPRPDGGARRFLPADVAQGGH